MNRSWMAVVLGLGLGCVRGWSQGVVGTVSATDATVTDGGNVVKVDGGVLELSGNRLVKALDGRNAVVKLKRGGDVLVCQTSVLHATESGGGLLLALDRGAMEIRMKAVASDVVMTPDLRFTLSGAGPLDLQMRVSPDGDTCVENRGHKAPVLKISDAFGEASYEVKAGQHVMFEHGSLREVVDRETVPCGCPPEAKPGMSIADAVLSGKGAMTPAQAEAAHPFPAAVSEGLAAPEPVPPVTSTGGAHVQVGATLTYDPTVPKSADAAAAAQTASGAPAAAAPPPAPVQKSGPFAAIGHFFKRMFVR